MTPHGHRTIRYSENADVAGDHDVESSRQKKLKWFFRITADDSERKRHEYEQWLLEPSRDPR